MSWVSTLFTSSLGRKLVMALTGLFLILFLLVHLTANLQLLRSDGGETFNLVSEFMGHNPVVQTVAWGLYLFIVIHTLLGIRLWLANRHAKGQKYLVQTKANASFASKNMAILGILIFAFLMIHMGDFWWKLQFTDEPYALLQYAGMSHPIEDVYTGVVASFKNPVVMICYLIGYLALGIHLWHGFQSAFQTLGLNHMKYNGLIKFLGTAYAVLVPLGFALISIYIFLMQ
ncbi:MAG TPA: succinate dehydrogenase cytochrome b subunit [Saprospiraceae bacterium]|nr:succinate dehydrogenase cytochrome b subunit [Saprospiraceae bacterium]MCB9271923.1 succinate dehydrogenase cytochrome b subunit [Lewinellaceae bacterium]HPG07663.1 succinate dehydrogenase cytochrome b subunit [Saprospiraceae bacterium]HPQ98793.1 succinate dehydrogenase cytochrome b subunit [Saprospiraceae bacterium]HQU54533.1 succinate dehydrogenase cytochrome b subunit [Saprospiraceae bacterium]